MVEDDEDTRGDGRVVSGVHGRPDRVEPQNVRPSTVEDHRHAVIVALVVLRATNALLGLGIGAFGVPGIRAGTGAESIARFGGEGL